MADDARPVEQGLLSAEECADPHTLERFVREHISANAWPIHAPALLRKLRKEGLSLAAARSFSPSFDELAALLPALHARSTRLTRRFGIDNAFHTTIHNFEVLLRLLVLEWPPERHIPVHLRDAPLRSYHTLEEIAPPLLEWMEALLAVGFPPPSLARDVLSALGHDYGHTGGTDRIDEDGRPCPLTHEETAERHVACLGLSHGFPPALIIESLAGIRATTFFSRPGRDRIEARTDFERRLTLADVMGCILPPDQWLVHIGMPVYAEKLPFWECRLRQLPAERAQYQAQVDSLPEGDPGRSHAQQALDVIAREERLVIQDLAEWFRSERGFFLFIEGQRLKAVPHAIPLWGGILKERIQLMEHVLANHEVLDPLSAKGLPLLEAMAARLANAPSLEAAMQSDGMDPGLRKLLSAFLPTP